MRNIYKTVLLIILITSCGSGKTFDPVEPNDKTIDDIRFGADSTFEAVTWNLQNFPKQQSITVDLASRTIKALSPELIALQEIQSSSYFFNLLTELNAIDTLHIWDGFKANSASYDIDLAYIYKASEVELIGDIIEIFSGEQYDRPFPRKPLKISLVWNSIRLTLIDNHYKCCGDGEIDANDEWDEELRRYDASILMEQYISENLPDENVIMLGDLNDSLTDPAAANVFQCFFDLEEYYLFADLEIAIGHPSNWSWGNGSGHLDHILITNELFDEFVDSLSTVETIRIDDYMEYGWQEYDEKISDHLPVGLKLKF